MTQNPVGECIKWRGTHRASDGRPMTSGNRYAYRVKWEHKHGRPCPEGKVAHHLCENSWCVNPDHLEFIEQGEHLKRHGLPGDWGQADKTHCPQGHEYTPENTYVYKGRGKNERHCKECVRAAKRRYRERQRLLKEKRGQVW